MQRPTLYHQVCTKWSSRILILNNIVIRTYTTDKINIVGSCSLFVVHPDANSLKWRTFYVTSHECSVVLSCETNLRLTLIHPHSNWNLIPDCASLICNNADHPWKRKSKKSVQGKYVNQCVKDKVPVLDETNKQGCQACIIEDYKNYQSIVCPDKNCQEIPNVHMCPVKPTKESKHMQSVTRLSNRKSFEPTSKL